MPVTAQVGEDARRHYHFPMLPSSLHFTPPPRRVPPSLTILSILGPFSQIAWFVFGFGMIFFWVFVGHADFSALTFRGAIEKTIGRVTSVQETGASENRSRVMASHYEYSVAGQRFTGTSYTTGSSPAEGDSVTVEYKQGQPESSRIEGMRRAEFGPAVGFVTIFPFIGLVLIAFSARGGFKRAGLLGRGVFTTGTLIGKEPTNMRVNNRLVYELTFEFTARDGRRCEATARTSDTARLEDEASEPLLYDPEDPSKAFVLDELPSRPAINGVGELVGKPVAAVLAMIIPGLVIAAHALYFYFRLR